VQSQNNSENSHEFEHVAFLSEENRWVFQQAADIVNDLEQLGIIRKNVLRRSKIRSLISVVK
jgi:hypothetical protein